jgi:hypothetical protein
MWRRVAAFVWGLWAVVAVVIVVGWLRDWLACR